MLIANNDAASTQGCLLIESCFAMAISVCFATFAKSAKKRAFAMLVTVLYLTLIRWQQHNVVASLVWLDHFLVS